MQAITEILNLKNLDYKTITLPVLKRHGLKIAGNEYNTEKC